MRAETRGLALVSLVFLADGMSQGAIGPALQDLAARARTTPAAAGALLTAIYVGAFLGQSLAAVFAQRLGPRRVMAGAMLLFAAGSCGLILGQSLGLLILAAGIKGFADGVLLLMGNVAASQMRGAGALNLVNAMFGVGAIFSPALIGLSMGAFGSALPALWLIPPAMALAALLLPGWSPGTARSAAGLGAVLGQRVVWLVAGLCLCEVALEAGIATWMTTLLQGLGLMAAEAAWVGSLFWGVMTLSRFAAAGVSRRIAARVLLCAAVGLAILGTASLVLAWQMQSPGLAIAAIAATAAGLGPVLPTALALLRQACPEAADAATGLAFSACSIGGALVPLAIGLLIAGFGGLAGVLGFLALALVLAAILGRI